MAFLQRPPIDVNAMVDGVPSPERMYEATLELLNMSQTTCPHAGLILRGAVSIEMVRETVDKEGLTLDAAAQELDFLDPLNQAMHDWWQENPLASDVTPEDLQFIRKTSAPKLEDHIDQTIPIRGVSPKYGPLTATLTLRGSMDYRLATTRIDVFSDRARGRLEIMNHTRHLPHRVSHVRANETDAVVFVNTPPTLHGGTGDYSRKTLLYGSHFRTDIG